MYVNTIAIVVFNVDYIWTLSLMVCSTAIFFGFEIFNPAIELKEAIGTSIFYAMGIYAATIARKTQSILGQKAFLMSLRNQYRSDALQSANHQLEILATRDPLTGLGNRRSATDLIDRLWRDPTIPKARIAFIMADIDLFKRLNDTAGHAAGDDCIRRVAKTIEESVRSAKTPSSAMAARNSLSFSPTPRPIAPGPSRNASAARWKRSPSSIPEFVPWTAASGVVTISLGVAFAREECRAGDGRKMGRRRALRRQAWRQERRVPVECSRCRRGTCRHAQPVAAAVRRQFGAQFAWNDDVVGRYAYAAAVATTCASSCSRFDCER